MNDATACLPEGAPPPASSDVNPGSPSAHDAAVAQDRVTLDRLSQIGAIIASERDPDRVIQRVTDEATALVRAQFGAFFYNAADRSGESDMPVTLSGTAREAFSRFPVARSASLFATTFAGEGIVRIADLAEDPRYDTSEPCPGTPGGSSPVRSYLAAPVKAITGEVLGGLFFGHAQPDVFDEGAERSLLALCTLAGSALSNARLFAELATREAQLRESEARHRLVSEAAQEGIWYWDVATNKVTWSDRLLALMGVSRDAWGGTFDDWFQRLHPEDQPRLARALDDHLTRRVPYRIELFRLRHADGGYRWCTTAGQAEWGDDGRPTRMAGSFRDITDRKAAEDKLRENELRYAQILDSVQDMMFTKNERLEVTWANAAASRFYGMSHEQPRGGPEDPSTTRAFPEGDGQDDRAVFESGLPVERAEEPCLAPGGELRTFHTVKTPIKSADGRVVELVGVSRDVTERKRELDAQRLLAQASAILSASIEYEQTLANVTRATVPLFADWAAVDILGEPGTLRRLAVHHVVPEKVVLAHELVRKYPPDLNAPHGVAQVLRTGQVESMPSIPESLLVNAARDQEHLAILRALGLHSYIVVPILIQEQPVGAITFVSAESRRSYGPSEVAFAVELARRSAVAIENAQLYAQVRELATTLEQRVTQRTAALVEANGELESFSYTVSHDLRAPVRHISGFTDMLRDGLGTQLDAKSLRYLSTIKAAATHMGALIDGLLSFSRLGRAELQMRRVDLTELVGRLLVEFEPDVRERKVHWKVGALPTVLGDPTMLQLVLSNFLGNALKYTRERAEAHIEVGSRRDGAEHVIWIKDDGVGFDMAYTDKLFGVFQRLHAEERFEGTGIGLATARRIVSRHGGRVWAEGELGHGASFYFSLPIERAP